MTSPQQLAANRANAQKSTGPPSFDGKTKVSHNALDGPAVLSEAKVHATTRLTGRTVLLPSDDVAAYQAHTERVFLQYSPETGEESRLTQSIADTLWRLERTPALEAGIYAIGRREFGITIARKPWK